jgi:N12 class adenine-specific DNA methylase
MTTSRSKFEIWHVKLSLAAVTMAAALARGRRVRGDLEYIRGHIEEVLKELNEQIYSESRTADVVSKDAPVSGGVKQRRKARKYSG